METLTIEASAAISAFVQKLAIKAEGREPVDEETLALRLLAAEHASPDFDLSAIHSSTQSRNGPVVASADGDDKFAKLAALMMGDTKSPAEQAEAGNAPKPAPIIILPGYDIKDVQSNYDSLMDANSMIQLYANLLEAQQKPGGFNINTEAAEAFNFQAKTAFDAMSGPMAGFFNFSDGSTQSFSNEINRDQIHDFFINSLFGNFGFAKATRDQLDGQLKTFVAGLSKIVPGNQATIAFSHRLGLVPRINVAGDDENPIWLYQPTIFLLRMSFDANTFYKSISKNSGNDQVKFTFSLTVSKFSLNVKKFEQSRDKFDKIFQLVTNSNLKAYSELLNKKLKTEEANPGK